MAQPDNPANTAQKYMDKDRLPEKPTIRRVKTSPIDRLLLGDHYSIETTSTIPNIGPIVWDSVYTTKPNRELIQDVVKRIAEEWKTSPAVVN